MYEEGMRHMDEQSRQYYVLWGGNVGRIIWPIQNNTFTSNSFQRAYTGSRGMKSIIIIIQRPSDTNKGPPNHAKSCQWGTNCGRDRYQIFKHIRSKLPASRPLSKWKHKQNKLKTCIAIELLRCISKICSWYLVPNFSLSSFLSSLPSLSSFFVPGGALAGAKR